MIAGAAAAVALARGPVVESVTQRSAIISFRTTAAVRAFVVLRNGARIDAGAGVDHVVRLTQLTPGMHYRYMVETNSGLVAEGRLRAAPARAARFTFAVVSDFGSGTRDERAVASMIEGWHPDFVLTVGDNAYPLGASALLDRDIFGPYAAVMRESAWFPALGNHDVKANGGNPELEAFHSLGNGHWYRFTWGSAAVVVLDSDVSVRPGSPQLRFARRSPALDSCLRFAAWHHPPWEPPGRPYSPDLRRNIVPLVEKDGVRVVFVGHLHAYARSRPRHGVVYVAVGTGGATLDNDAQTDHSVSPHRPRPIRRTEGRRGASRGALQLRDGRRPGARPLPRDLLYRDATQTEEHTVSQTDSARERLIETYRKKARHYDITSRLYPVPGYPQRTQRLRAVQALGLRPGASVVDIACGTGLNFSLIEQLIGPDGRIVGVDLTDAMLAQAQHRIESNGWSNIDLVEADAAGFDFPAEVDAILSTYALSHVPECRDVIAHGAAALSRGGRWVVLDLKVPDNTPRWLARPVGSIHEWMARRPWEAVRAAMQDTLDDLSWSELFFGTAFLAAASSSSANPAAIRG